MTGHHAVRLALRTRLRTLAVCATAGDAVLAATSSGYTRDAGSFLDDGFAVGMEVVPEGFAAEPTPQVVTGVTATSLLVTPAPPAEAAAPGRVLRVGLPAAQAWENVEFTPEAGVPHVVEEYLPGPSRQVGGARQFTLGPGGELEVLPLYVVKVYVAAGLGAAAADAYADALLRHFAPRTTLSVEGGSLQVRTNPAPYRGLLLPAARAGFAFVPVTVPLRLRTATLLS